MKKVSFFTLGCRVNQYETEAMAEAFIKKGYEIADFNDLCDVYVVNSCTVTAMGDKKSRQLIRKVKRQNENFDLLSNSISLLYNGLVNFELEHFKQSITNSLFDNESIYYLLGKENNEYFYLSENLSERLKIKNPCTATCDAVKPFINHHLVKKVNLRFPFVSTFNCIIECEFDVFIRSNCSSVFNCH